MMQFLQRYAGTIAPPLIKRDGIAVGMRMERSAEIRAIDENAEGKIYRFVITSNTPDRYNDIVEADGGDFSHYMRNPVVFYNHNTHGDMLPIGKCLTFSVEDNKIVADVVFDAEDPYAKQIESKVARGFLNAVSIGFIPLEGYECRPEEAGVDAGTLRPISNTIGVYTKWEIIEFSVVGIPANTDALIVNNTFNKDNKSKVMTLTLDTNTTTAMEAKEKALAGTDVEEFVSTATQAFKTVILKLLQDYELDFSTTDVATVAAEFANGTIQAFGGVVEEPAPEAPAAPAPETMNAKAYEFKDELDFFLQLKDAHKAELEMCSAAMNLPNLSENGLEIISNLATVLPEEIENLHEHVLVLEGNPPAEGEAEEGAEPMPMTDAYKRLAEIYAERAGAAISAKTRQLLQKIYDSHTEQEKIIKMTKNICKELIESGQKEPSSMNYTEEEAINAIEDAIKNELSFF